MSERATEHLLSLLINVVPFIFNEEEKADPVVMEEDGEEGKGEGAATAATAAASAEGQQPTASASTGQAASRGSEDPDIAMLMDMGFSREDALQGLRVSSSSRLRIIL